MLVSKSMTSNPIFVDSNETVVEAMYLMRSKNIRRLPVINEGKLVGIVTERDLSEVSASPASTLSVYELNYLLSKMKINDVMKKKVLTVRPEATIEEAALIMFEKKVGGLVVADEHGKVVGIVTATDMFRTFVEVMGISQRKSTRLTIDAPDKVGVICDISGIFKEIGLNIDSFVSHMVENGDYQLIVRAIIPDVEKVVTLIEEKGYKVSHIVRLD